MAVQHAEFYPHTFGNRPAPGELEPIRRFDLAPLALGGLEKETPRRILRQLRKNWQQLEMTNPDYFVGAAVFGSTVKGRMRPGSDIDMVLFVNSDSIAAPELSEADMSIIEAFLNTPDTSLQDPLARGSRVERPIVVNVSPDALTSGIEEFTRAGEDTWQNIISFTSPGVMMFCLSLGSFPGKEGATLQDARRYYLDELTSHGTDGETVFQRLMILNHKIEERFRGDKNRLPQTIADAKRYWRL